MTAGTFGDGASELPCTRGTRCVASYLGPW
ncbi:MAG: hypothetical protein QOD46_831, partial [Actinomycetota bacterium]|nr:hypothetical protein [Actinomycetota bacterium]